jgi:hypothetical protein
MTTPNLVDFDFQDFDLLAVAVDFVVLNSTE